MKAEIRKAIKLLKYVCTSKKSRVILIDTPIHGNVGDSAIAVAEKQMLQQRGISFIELVANDVDGIENLYAKFTPKSCKILVHGGGFLGSVWKKEELRFRRILQAFDKHHIVVLPQTVYFDLNSEKEIEFFDESKRIYENHNNLIVFVREENSLNFMSKYMSLLKVKLVPDVVLSLKYKQIPLDRKNILLCFRHDYEKCMDTSIVNSIVGILNQYYIDNNINYTDTVIRSWIEIEKRNDIVNKKLTEFASAKLVVTDRLHGMIFAFITRTPCLVFSNSTGKIEGVYNKWLKKYNFIKYCNSIQEFEKNLKLLNEINKIENIEFDNNLFNPLYKEID